MRGYLLASFDVKGKISFEKYFSNAVAKAKGLGGRWFVLPATLAFDSTAPDESGGYHRAFVKKMLGKGEVCRMYTVPWDQLSKEDRATCWAGDLLKGKVIINGHEMKVHTVRKRIARFLGTHPMIESAWSQEGKTYLVLISGKRECWLQRCRERLGIHHAPGGKMVKRMSQVFRKFIAAVESKKIQVRLIPGGEVTMDGAGLHSPGLTRMLVADMERRGVHPAVIERFKACKVLNLRAWLPGGILEGYDLGALIKEQSYEASHLGDEPILLVTKENLKKEVRVEAGRPIRVGVIPQPGKLKPTRTTIQGIIQVPWLYAPDLVRGWTKNTFASLTRDLSSRENLEEDWFETCKLAANGRVDEDGHYTTVSRKMAEFNELVPTEWAPTWLQREFFSSRGQMVVDGESGHIRAKVPYSTHCQVVSQELADHIQPGFGRVRRGEVEFMDSHLLYVIEDEDYLGFVKNHGGSDLDDFEDQVFRRTPGGRVYVVMLRSPLGWGEWDLYWWPEDRPLPNGWTKEELPIIDIPKGKASTPRSVYRETVESPFVEGTKPDWTKQYSEKEYALQVENEGLKAGVGVNVYTAYCLFKKWDWETMTVKDDSTPPVTLEKIVDMSVQSDSLANQVIVQGILDGMDEELKAYCEEGNFLDARFVECKKIGKRWDDVPLNVKEGWFSKLLTDCEAYKEAYLEEVEKIEAKVPDLAGYAYRNNGEDYLKVRRLVVGLQKLYHEAEGDSGKKTIDGMRWLEEKRDALLEESNFSFEILEGTKKGKNRSDIGFFAWKVYCDGKDGAKKDYVLCSNKVLRHYAWWLALNPELRGTVVSEATRDVKPKVTFLPPELWVKEEVNLILIDRGEGFEAAKGTMDYLQILQWLEGKGFMVNEVIDGLAQAKWLMALPVIQEVEKVTLPEEAEEVKTMKVVWVRQEDGGPIQVDTGGGYRPTKKTGESFTWHVRQLEKQGYIIEGFRDGFVEEIQAVKKM